MFINEVYPPTAKSQLFKLTYDLEFERMKPIHQGNLEEILILIQKVCPELYSKTLDIHDPRALKNIFDQIGIDSHAVHFSKGWWIEIHDFDRSPYAFRNEHIDILLKGLNEICDLTGNFVSPVSYDTVVLSITQHSFAMDFLPAHPCYIIRDWDSDEGSSYKITAYPNKLHIEGYEQFRAPEDTHFSYGHYEPRHFEAITRIISNQIHKDTSRFKLRLITESHSYPLEGGSVNIEYTEYRPQTGEFTTLLALVKEPTVESTFSMAEMKILIKRANSFARKLGLSVTAPIWK